MTTNGAVSDAHGNGDGNAFGIENSEFAPILPVETRAGSQAIVMLSRMSSRVRPSDSPSKTREISS